MDADKVEYHINKLIFIFDKLFIIILIFVLILLMVKKF